MSGGPQIFRASLCPLLAHIQPQSQTQMLTYPESGMDKEWEAVIAVLHGLGPVWDDFMKEVNLGVVGLGSW